MSQNNLSYHFFIHSCGHMPSGHQGTSQTCCGQYSHASHAGTPQASQQHWHSDPFLNGRLQQPHFQVTRSDGVNDLNIHFHGLPWTGVETIVPTDLNVTNGENTGTSQQDPATPFETFYSPEGSISSSFEVPSMPQLAGAASPGSAAGSDHHAAPQQQLGSGGNLDSMVSAASPLTVDFWTPPGSSHTLSPAVDFWTPPDSSHPFSPDVDFWTPPEPAPYTPASPNPEGHMQQLHPIPTGAGVQSASNTLIPLANSTHAPLGVSTQAPAPTAQEPSVPPTPRRHKCVGCEKQFVRLRQFRRHCEESEAHCRLHGLEPTKYICACGSTALRKDNHRRHLVDVCLKRPVPVGASYICRCGAAELNKMAHMEHIMNCIKRSRPGPASKQS